MNVRRVLALTLSFLALSPGAVPYAGMDAVSGTGKDHPAAVAAISACGTVAGILAAYPALEVRASEGPVRSLPGIPGKPGCRILAEGPSSGVSGGIDPALAVRARFQDDGWVEDIRHAADGPGTTSFLFRKNGAWCTAHGGPLSWIEDGFILTSQRYELEIECVSDPDGAAPVP